MKKITETLSRFTPITLAEMDSVQLLDRMDLKFIFHARMLPEILELVRKDFRVLEVEGNRACRYVTMYMDTPDFEMYKKHHNGQSNRCKIRFRTYVESQIHFFEIKFKNNKGRTIKKRVNIPENNYLITDQSKELLETLTQYDSSSLVPALQINYNRITLVNNNKTERVTIDFGMNYRLQGQTEEFKNLIIAEVKQGKSEKSAFTSLMTEKRIKETSLSKYSFGIACFAPNVKSNNFKQKILYVNKLCAS